MQGRKEGGHDYKCTGMKRKEWGSSTNDLLTPTVKVYPLVVYRRVKNRISVPKLLPPFSLPDCDKQKK